MTLAHWRPNWPALTCVAPSRTCAASLPPATSVREACAVTAARPGWPAGLKGQRPLVLDSTGDVISSDRHAQFKQQAHVYAARYNRALAQWLAMSEVERRQAPPPLDAPSPFLDF